MKATEKNVWQETNRLFIKKNGGPMHPDTPTKWFNKFLNRHKLAHTCIHNLRHVHGSLLLTSGMDLNSVADQMGHSNIQMLVSRYSHNITKNSPIVADHLAKALFKKDEV